MQSNASNFTQMLRICPKRAFNKVLMTSLRYAQILLTQNFIKTNIKRNYVQ